MTGAAGEKPGGFLTGWKGWVVLLTAIAAAVVIAGTAVFGSVNTYPRIVGANLKQIDAESTDFGRTLYLPCITQNATYNDGNWQAEFTLRDGTKTKKIQLEDQDNVYFLGDLYNGTADEPARYINRPEAACYSICQQQLGPKGCTVFTYDGITEDSCRFLKPGSALPAVQDAPFSKDPYFYIYNATCMLEERNVLIAAFEKPKTGLVRPTATIGPPATSFPNGTPDFLESLAHTFTFFKLMWAGMSPEVFWRKIGFAELDSGCKETSYDTSFATGDHIVSTMAVASQTGIVSLGMLWWSNVFNTGVRNVAAAEIQRQADFLTSAWDAKNSELLIGVGDSINDTTNQLDMYSDFGSADRALAIGPQPDTDPFGPLLPVAPKCSYADEEDGAAEVAAHTAAALALSASALAKFTAGAINQDYIDTAESLLEYSQKLAPIDATADELKAATDPRPPEGSDAKTKFGASYLYGIDDSTWVYAHQIWASCTLYQATNKTSHWNTTEALYKRWIRTEEGDPEGITALYFPVANYNNPVFFALMCMAQSAPVASGIATESQLSFNVAAGGNNATLFDLFLSQQPLPATRLEVLGQIWNNFVTPWINITADSKSDITANSLNLRFAALTDDDAKPAAGLFRDSANAAWLALMYADLPGVRDTRARLARCMALQNVRFILGDNTIQVGGTTGFSFQVGLGNSYPKNPYSKDAACPPAEVRDAQFEPLFISKNFTGADANANRTRQCDYLTFQGNPMPNPSANGSGPATINPLLPNSFELTGALVSHFKATGGANPYTDQRVLEGGKANGQAQVSIDYNAALANAVAGLAALPASFYAEECPSIPDMQALLVQDTQAETDSQTAASGRLSGPA